MPAQKIATCCYCGSRAALVLRGAKRQELSCSNCGAPLHDLKMLPKASTRATAPAATPARPTPKPAHPKQPHPRPRKIKKRKHRNRLWREVIEELWDEIEDIFD